MAGWRGVSWLYARILPPADLLVSRLSGRKLTLVGITTGLPVLLLTTIRAKTGALRVNPVLYLRSSEDFVVIASNWGQPHNPGWYYNLRAHPKATVTLYGATFNVLAREATAPERDLTWAQAVRMYPAWNTYKARAPRREFPILILSRVAASVQPPTRQQQRLEPQVRELRGIARLTRPSPAKTEIDK